VPTALGKKTAEMNQIDKKTWADTFNALAQPFALKCPSQQFTKLTPASEVPILAISFFTRQIVDLIFLFEFSRRYFWHQ
jgi:hypothetical protein